MQLTSPPEQHNRKTEGPMVTDWTILYKLPDAPTVTPTCHHHIWWVAQWNATGTTDRVHTFTPETRTATPLAPGDRFRHSIHHTDHPLAHWLALKTAMQWMVDAPTSDTTLPATWLTLTRNLAAYIRKHGTSGRNAGCPGLRTRKRLSNIAPPTCKNTPTNFEVCTDPVRDKDQHTASSTTSTTATRRKQPRNRPKPRPRPEGAGILARAKRRKPDPKGAQVPAPPEPQPKPKPQACPFFTVAERNAMHPEWQDGAEVQGVFGATLKGQPKQFVWFRGKMKGRLATPGQHGNLQLKITWQALPEWGKKAETSNLKLWNDRPFPECPVQLRTSAKQVLPGNVSTGDLPQAWLEEPNIPEEQLLATPINLKLRLGQ